MHPTPGVVYIARTLPLAFTHLALVYTLIHAVGSQYFRVPSWFIPFVYVLSALLVIGFCLLLTDFKEERKAVARGAVLPRQVHYKYILTPRGPPGARFLGYNLFNWSDEYGPLFRFRVWGEHIVFTSEPEHIKSILVSNFSNFEKGPGFQDPMRTFLGNGIFNSDGKVWKTHRSMTKPFFKRKGICHFDILDRHAMDVLELLKRRMAEGMPIDWQDLVGRFAFDSATEFLFGKDFKSLSDPLPYPSTARNLSGLNEAVDNASISQALQEAVLMSCRRIECLMPWQLHEITEDKVARPMKVINNFLDDLLQDALAKKIQSQREISGDDDTLLSHLVKQSNDPRMIKDEILNILLAGRDSVSISLTCAVYVLSEHPEILSRLRSEILECVGPIRCPTYDDIHRMRYLRAFINEVLRLYPAVPFNIRRTINATEWMSPGESQPFFIPARTQCLFSVFLMHRRKDLWGPDAHEFDPERFLDDRVTKYLVPNPFIFLPFSGGPRICLGQQFAYNQISFMLIRLLQQISSITLLQEAHPESIPPPEWANCRGSNGREKIWLNSHIALYIRGGLWVKMEDNTEE